MPYAGYTYTYPHTVGRQKDGFKKNCKEVLLPPSESCSSLVSFESLYGTWDAFLDLSPNADITFPKANCKSKIKTLHTCKPGKVQIYNRFTISLKCIANIKIIPAY